MQLPPNASKPTLIPNFDKPVASGHGTVDLMNPAAFLAANPRSDATATATIAGTVTAGDQIALNIANGVLASSALGGLSPAQVSVSYTVQAGDTVDTIAEGLADAVNDNTALQLLNFRADTAGAVITFHHSGPVGNLTTVTDTLSGGATETVTFSNGGVLSGGAGPVFAAALFTFPNNGVINEYFYGQPYTLPYTLVQQLVSQGYPIL